jgi:uncharacterized protein (TIGR03435 family)
MTIHNHERPDTADSHLGLFRAPPEEEMAQAEERALRRLRSEPRYAPAPARPPLWRMSRLAVAGAAAAIVFAVIALRPPRSETLFRVVEGEVHQVDSLRSDGGKSAVLALADGSRIEMRAGSELSLTRADDGLRILLNRGDIIVNAAKQRRGHLYVQTKDITVSVIGTVFVVNADKDGSRVAVIEGEVRVQQGSVEKTLRPGEQIATNPLLTLESVREEIAWSPHAETHLALLQQINQTPGARDAFDVISIRSSGKNAGAGRGGGQGAYSIENGCGGLLPIEIDPGRFAVFGTTVHNLIIWAYGTGEIHYGSCINLNAMNFVSGGPDWIRTEPWDIQAVVPARSLDFTLDQLRRGDLPRLRRMIQTMLAERFKVTMRRETKSVAAYSLTAEKGAPRFFVPDIYAGGREDPAFKKYVWDERPSGARPGDLGIIAKDAFMSEVVPILARRVGRPVVDETGIAGKVDFILYYDWAPNPARPSTAPPLAKALDQVGLKLSDTRTVIETWVVEKVEKPTEN